MAGGLPFFYCSFFGQERALPINLIEGDLTHSILRVFYIKLFILILPIMDALMNRE